MKDQVYNELEEHIMKLNCKTDRYYFDHVELHELRFELTTEFSFEAVIHIEWYSIERTEVVRIKYDTKEWDSEEVAQGIYDELERLLWNYEKE